MNFESIEQLVKKRTLTFAYLKKIYEGDNYWLDSVLISRNDIDGLFSRKSDIIEERTKNFFFLGLNLGPFLEISNGVSFLINLKAMLDEFSARVKIKKTRKVKLKQDSGIQFDDSAQGAGFLSDNHQFHFFEGNFKDFDYAQVSFALLDLLNQLYNKLMDPSLCDPIHRELIFSIDEWVYSTIIDPIVKEMSEFALGIMEQQLSEFDPLFKEAFEYRN